MAIKSREAKFLLMFRNLEFVIIISLGQIFNMTLGKIVIFEPYSWYVWIGSNWFYCILVSSLQWRMKEIPAPSAVRSKAIIIQAALSKVLTYSRDVRSVSSICI